MPLFFVSVADDSFSQSSDKFDDTIVLASFSTFRCRVLSDKLGDEFIIIFVVSSSSSAIQLHEDCDDDDA
jgi:hypothetical protein